MLLIDTGEVGAGHSVTILYELVPVLSNVWKFASCNNSLDK